MLELKYNNFLGSDWVNWEEYKLQYAKSHGSSSFIENYPNERSHMFRYIDTETKEIYTNIKDITVIDGKIVEKSKREFKVKILNNLIIEKRLITVNTELYVYDGNLYGVEDTDLRILLNAKDILKIKHFETNYDHNTDTKIYTYEIKYTKEL